MSAVLLSSAHLESELAETLFQFVLAGGLLTFEDLVVAANFIGGHQSKKMERALARKGRLFSTSTSA